MLNSLVEAAEACVVRVVRVLTHASFICFSGTPVPGLRQKPHTHHHRHAPSGHGGRGKGRRGKRKTGLPGSIDRSTASVSGGSNTTQT